VTLAILRAACDNGRTCPNINRTEQGTLVVQGYPASEHEVRLAALDSAPGGMAVWIPLSLVPEVAAASSAASALRVVNGDSVLIVGAEVTDPEMLAELDLPAGESAIEISVDLLPFLEVSADAR
jgi:hypothetical protein